MPRVYTSALLASRVYARRFLAVAAFALLAILGLAANVNAAELNHREIIATDGIPLNVVETGPVDGPAIVLLHGFSQSYLSWSSQFQDPQLTDTYHLVALDLRGHGGSGKPWKAEAYRNAETWADDVQVVINELGLESPLLVGWSFGGYILLDYVRVHGTESIAGLMLIGSHGGLLPRPPAGAESPNGDLETKLRDARNFMQRMSARPLSPAAMEEGVASYMMLPDYARRAIAGKNLDNTDLVDALDVPVQFLLGTEEKFVDHEQLRSLVETMDCTSLIFQDGAGHMPFIEDAAAFDQLLVQFSTALGSEKGSNSCGSF